MVSKACVTSGKTVILLKFGLSSSRSGRICDVALILFWNLQWPLRRGCKPSHVTLDPGRGDLLKYIVNCISQTEGSMGIRQREVFSRLRYGMQLGNGGCRRLRWTISGEDSCPLFVDSQGPCSEKRSDRGLSSNLNILMAVSNSDKWNILVSTHLLLEPLFRSVLVCLSRL